VTVSVTVFRDAERVSQQRLLAQQTTPYLCTKWHLDPCSRLAAIDMGRKLGALSPSLGGGWVSSEHKVPWDESYPIPSGMLMYPAVWPQ